MSGPLSFLTDSLARLTQRRSDARARARLARLSEGLVYLGIRHQPEVRDFGDLRAARAALKGQLILQGTPLSTGADLTPWDLSLPSQAMTDELHGFAWLDDFAGLAGKAARRRAQGWTLGWLDRFAQGSGPGWSSATAAQRLKRIVTHLPFLEKDLPSESLARIQSSLPLHTAFVAETWRDENQASDVFRALSGLLHASACLSGFQEHFAPTTTALEDALATHIQENGGIASRNPAELMEIFRELLHIQALFEQVATQPNKLLDHAIARIAPTLRLLRHGDGTLARFHGGGSGPEAELDRALAESRIRTRPGETPAMGFARLHGGRVHLIVDCARPPERSDCGHASTLAFEMSSGRRPVFVNCGPQIMHLTDWQRAPRTTPAHNTLALDRVSSSRMGPVRAAGKPGFDALQARPSMVTLAQASDSSGMWIQSRHDGYLEDYGLLHERRLFVGALGHEVHGEDVLLSPDAKSERRFSNRIKGAAKLGVSLTIHFHLHPDVEVDFLRATETCRLILKSGEVWLFRHDGGVMDLESSVYLDPTLPEAAQTKQIVISSRATTHKAEINWSLVRENVAPHAVRDVAIDAPSG